MKDFIEITKGLGGDTTGVINLKRKTWKKVNWSGVKLQHNPIIYPNFFETFSRKRQCTHTLPPK